MLRYILLKLPGIANKTDSSVSSKCNQLRQICPLSANRREARSSQKRSEVQHDGRKLCHRRAYSFPAAKPKSAAFLDKELYGTWTDLKEFDDDLQKKEVLQRDRKCVKKVPNRTLNTYREHSATQHKKVRSDKFASKNRELDNLIEEPSYNTSDQYELEAARPRRSQSELSFNVFDYTPNDPTRYLQPSKLRPFGSTDNTYLPLLVESRSINVTRFNNKNLQGPQDSKVPKKEVDLETLSSKKSIISTKEHTAPITDYYYEKKKKGCLSKDLATYNELDQKHKELEPPYVSKKLSPKADEKSIVDEALEVADKYKMKPANNKGSNKSIIKYLDETSPGNTVIDKNDNLFESHRLKWNEPRINFEPPPFLSSTGMCVSLDTRYVATKYINEYKYQQVPWPAYSERVKENSEKNLLHEPDVDIPVSQSEIHRNTHQKQTSKIKPMHIERENLDSSTNISPKELLSSDPLDTVYETPKGNESVTSRSSVFVTKAQPINPLSLSNRKMYTSSNRTCAKPSTSRIKVRAFEPESCIKEEEPKKCFLPSKVRLHPPHCTARPPYRECIVENQCSPRADQCYKVLPKKLPLLQKNKCPCVEPDVPVTNPKLRRLKFQFLDPPRNCPCKICPCPPRADDSMEKKIKKLPQYNPGNCECMEPPPMQEVRLIRLKKICEPEEKCYPQPECPEPEPCERADDNRKDHPKFLPVLKNANCPCVEPYVPNSDPKMKRLVMEFKDPPRVCPCNPCPCPPRADAFLKQKIKKLPIYKPGSCACIEPPKMTDAPLKRLVKVCPPEVCNPPKECPVEVCDVTVRADYCLENKPKKLPVLKSSKCVCIEPEIPNKNPKMKRLKMEFRDVPKLCIPESTCLPRADDTLEPKQKKLPVYVPGACKCIEPTPMIDVPLVKLQKICEPEEKCYPPKDCPEPELCIDKTRADDELCVRKKTLPRLRPSSCPCVEPPKMSEAPKLKRLDLHVPEPKKYCPVTTCADFSRADDNLKEKNRKLPVLKPGDCPCIEAPMVDVKPLPRLKCQDDEELCHCEDPCIPFPRADWGCWEYTQDINENVNKYKKSALKIKKITHNTKRRYNTDSRISSCSKSKPENKKKNETGKLSANKILDSNSFKDDLKLKPLNINELMAKELKDKSKSEVRFKLSKPEWPNTAPIPCKRLEVCEGAAQKKGLNSTVTSQLRANNSKSQPNLKFLRHLSDLEISKSDGILHNDRKINVKSMLNQLSITTALNKPTVNTNIRKISTNSVGQQEHSSRLISTGSVNYAKKGGKDKCKKEEPKICKQDRCEKVVLSICPQKTRSTCARERTPFYCEKKSSPFPAFSECIDEELEPYSKKVRNWTCNNRQYGFEPKPKKDDATLKNKKHFSTTSDTSHQHTNMANTSKIMDGHKMLLFNSSHILCPRRTRPIFHSNFSTTTNTTHFKDFNNQFPRYESSYKNKNKRSGKKIKCKRKKCKRKKCPKFTLPNCPPQQRKSCKMSFTICCKKRISPYPAFSDYMDADIEAGINECPLEKDKINLLQPKHPIDKPKIIDPISPDQGMIDPRLEDDCLRVKHCLKQEGISQCCEDFGKSIKPLKSRDFPRDSDRIEEMKRTERRRPSDHWTKRFCTCTNNNYKIHLREFCTSERPWISEQNKEKYLETINSTQIHENGTENTCGTYGQEYDNTKLCKSSRLYVRNYHVLCNNEKRNVVEDVDKKIKDVPQSQFTDIDEPCKYMKLRNVQWRINNFQKWRRLNKLSTLQSPAKQYHTCSKLKYRRSVKYSPIINKFSTSQCQVISDFTDFNALRGIATTMMLDKQRKNKFCAKKSKNSFNSEQYTIRKDCPNYKLPNCPPRERFMCKRQRFEAPSEKIVTPYPAFSECHDDEIRNTIMDCPLGQERIQRLQPQYPLVPEIETVALPPPYQGGIDPYLEIDYVRHKFGLPNEGVSQDCETFGQPIKYLKCQHIAGFSSSKPETVMKSACFPKKKAARNNYKKHVEERKLDKKKCPSLKTECITCSHPPKQVCELTLWQRIVNYFKARPNCPAPDEWKKKALREKAEKAAKAAGLCLVEPKEQVECRETECNDTEKLPKVITPQDSDGCEDENKHDNKLQSSSHNKKNTGDSCTTSNRRQFATVSRRCYSQNVNWKYFDEFNKLVEEEKDKRTVEEEPFTSVMDTTNSLNESTCNKDDDARSPDSYCLKVFNEAILNKDKLSDITKYVDIDITDDPINYSLQILTKNKDFMDILFNEPVDELTNYSEAQAIAAFQEYVNKMDALAEISYEDIENSKTNNLIKELNKLLDNKKE